MFNSLGRVHIPFFLNVVLIKDAIKIYGSRVKDIVKYNSALRLCFDKRGGLLITYSLNFLTSSRLTKQKIRTFLPALILTLKKKLEQVFYGLSLGFIKKFDIIGVGFKAFIDKSLLFLKLGFSHDILFSVPVGIEIFLPKENLIIIKSFSKSFLGAFIFKLQKSRFPDPYKNKGILCQEKSVKKKKLKKK